MVRRYRKARLKRPKGTTTGVSVKHQKFKRDRESKWFLHQISEGNGSEGGPTLLSSKPWFNDNTKMTLFLEKLTKEGSHSHLSLCLKKENEEIGRRKGGVKERHNKTFLFYDTNLVLELAKSSLNRHDRLCHRWQVTMISHEFYIDTRNLWFIDLQNEIS